MFYLISDRLAAERAHKAIQREFRKGANRTMQTLSTPGLVVRDASILIRRDLDLWAYFRDKPNRRGQLFMWFGIGNPDWQPSIEINVPTRRTLHTFTQIVADDDGELYLAHRGGLGGGKYSVGPGPFGALIDGFEREVVQDGENERFLFILGSISRPNELLSTLSEFVHEAERIRELRRRKRTFDKQLKAVGGRAKSLQSDKDDEYNDEKSGRSSYSVQRTIEIDRIHADVQRALASELKKRKMKVGNRRQKHGLGPDLYTRNAQHRMTHLFEIKVGQDSQSTFTAIGQLLVYSAGERFRPRAILVTRGLPRSLQFKRALDRQRIDVLLYSISPKRKISFEGLGAVLGKKD
jgi:hypothetical protein